MTLRCMNVDDGARCPLAARDASNFCPIHGPRGLAGSLNHIEVDNRKLRQRVARIEVTLMILVAVLVVHMAIKFLAVL